VPQSPQFSLSLAVVAQYTASSATQNFCLGAQVVEHAPALQTSPAPHVLPHAPQFARSTASSTHDEPHCTVPPPQLVAQAPCEQTRLTAHAASHAPQLNASL
jgi:hypothetical protein